jgi:hypothetical protein
MGTRGLIGFAVGGEVKLAYNHWDSYPDGLGVKVLSFVRQLVKDGAVDDAAQRVRDLKVVTDETPVTPADVQALKRWANTTVGGPTETGAPSWYQLLRETQGDPDAILTAGYLEDSSEFALDSLFCEWGYVINFDDKVLEVYRGFQQKPPTAGRWAGQEDPEAKAQREQQLARLGSGYYPINEIARFGFDELPTVEAFVVHVEGLSGLDNDE